MSISLHKFISSLIQGACQYLTKLVPNNKVQDFGILIRVHTMIAKNKYVKKERRYNTNMTTKDITTLQNIQLKTRPQTNSGSLQAT